MIKEWLLEALAKVENRVDDMGVAILGAIPHAIGGKGDLLRWTASAGRVFAMNLGIGTAFARAYVRALTRLLALRPQAARHLGQLRARRDGRRARGVDNSASSTCCAPCGWAWGARAGRRARSRA